MSSLKKPLILIMATIFAFVAGWAPAQAEVVVWNGDSSMLVSDPLSFVSQAILPTVPSNNTVRLLRNLPGSGYGGIWINSLGPVVVEKNTISTAGSSSSKGITGAIIGGYGRSGGGGVTVSTNTVNLNNGSVSSGVWGGYAEGHGGHILANINTVSLTGITIHDGSNYRDVYGATAYLYTVGVSGSRNVQTNENTLMLENTLFSKAYGGDAMNFTVGAAEANENTITITGGTFFDHIVGGYASTVSSNDTATASKNKVTIEGIGSSGTNNYIDGGEAFSQNYNAITELNEVSVSGISFADYSIVGGFSEGFRAYSRSNNVILNNITTTGSTFYSVGGEVHSNYIGEAKYNHIIGDNIGNGSGKIAGGFAGAYINSTPPLSYNTLTASNNTVKLTNSKITSLIGGYIYIEGTFAINSTLLATDNSVKAIGGEYTNIYGGYVEKDSGFAGTISSLKATNNTVTIEDVVEIGSLYGGAGTESSGPNIDYFSGNRLNVIAGQGLRNKITSFVGNFEYYNFTFTKTKVLGSDIPGLILDSGVNISLANSVIESVNTDPTRYKDAFDGPLAVGTELVLIATSGGSILYTNFDQTTATGLHGTTVKYTFDLDKTSSSLKAKVTSVGTSQQSKSVSEGFIGTLGSLLTGSDHAATTTIDEAVESAQAANAIGSNVIGSFGSVSAGNTRYNSGSHVDVHSFSASVGASYGIELNPGRVTLGLFLEFGYGDYDTYNSFPGVGVVLGTGHTSYVGGGFLARYDFAQSASGNFYTELTARFGQVQNDYSSDDLLPANQRVTYDSRTPYFGLHFGLGYDWNVSPAGVLNVYGKYLWNHQNGDDVILSSGDRVNFSAVNSHRVQVGLRYTHAVNAYFSPYVGASFEHEFDGRSKATTFGLPIEAPSIRGATGMGEVGFKFTPKPESPFSVDLGAKGYIGKREGVSGNLMIRLDF